MDIDNRFNVIDQDENNYTVIADGEKKYSIGLFKDIKSLNVYRLCCLLNGQHKQIDFLQKSVKRQQASNEECSKYIEEVNKENEELKESMNNLYNYFTQWFEEERGMYYDDFDEWWCNISKGETKFKNGYDEKGIKNE